MTSAVHPLPLRIAGRVPLIWGLRAYIWLLPIHILVMTILFGALGWPAPLVRAIAAWKETLIAVLLALASLRVCLGAGRPIVIRWLDLVIAGLVALGLAYLVGADVWFDEGLPAIAQLYGFRDAAFVPLLYFVGRATPEAAGTPRHLRALFIVGVLTSIVAIAERLLVGPETLILLGLASYVKDFIGAAVTTAGNVYGLPDNYWTAIGDTLVLRAGSIYLSAQGFAIPFLLIIPAATVFVTSPARTRPGLAWLGYATLWIALLLTLTRMTIVACFVQSVIILGMRRRWAALVTGGTATALAFLVLLVAIPGLGAFVWDTLTWQTGSSVSHLRDWREGFENFARHPLGVGLGATDLTAWRFGLTPLAGDNQYLRFAVELGILGLGLHLAVLAGATAIGISAWRRGRSDAVRDTGLVVATTALGIAINGWTAAVLSAMLLAYVFFWLLGSVTSAADEP